MGAETIWTLLKGRGFSDRAAAALLGQMEAESGCAACRVQGDFTKGYARSQEYTGQVDAGEISRRDFSHSGPGGGGYGLCQWTYYSRKEGLYDKAKSLGLSVGSEEAQISWLWDELHQAEFRVALEALTGDGSLREMTEVLTRRFERPADQSEAAVAQRTALAEKHYAGFAGRLGEAAPAPEFCGDTPTTPFWPPRMLTRGMTGSDVGALQALLTARGYTPGTIDGVLGERTEAAMWTFQQDAGMKSAGDFGPVSWGLLLKL